MTTYPINAYTQSLIDKNNAKRNAKSKIISIAYSGCAVFTAITLLDITGVLAATAIIIDTALWIISEVI